MDFLLPLLILSLIGIFWFDSLKARERAIQLCRSACQQQQVQLLDQTVVLTKLRFHYGAQGLRLRREYQFEYSEEGIDRQDGRLILFGSTVERLTLGMDC